MCGTNILTVYCGNPIDVYSHINSNYNNVPYYDANWKKLKDGSQVVCISWDPNCNAYLVAFRVEEEE